MSEVKRQFIDFMRSEGVDPADESQIQAGVFCRFDLADESRGKKSGFCLFHDDEHPNGIFGNLKVHNKNNPIQWKPKHKAAEAWTEEQRKAYADEQRRRAQARREAIAKLQAEAAEVSRSIWNQAKPAPASHPYLTRKRVQPFNLRESRGALVVPIIIAGELRSLQFINEDGSKRFKRGGELVGGYCPLGPKPTDRLVVCEGWATGATIQEASGLPVIVAFDAGNLKPVVQAMRAKFPDAEIIVASDDDRFTEKPVANPGLKAATEAMASVERAILRRPVFKSDEGRPTDFNDLAAQCGLSEVRIQILEGRPSFQVEQLPQVQRQRSEYSLLEPYQHMSAARGGKPLCTIENVNELLQRMEVTIRYDVIKKKIQVLIPGEEFSVDNVENASLARIKSWATFAKMPTGGIEEYLNYIADKNQFNPVVTWIKSKPWDGRSRMADFYNTVRSSGDQKLKETLMRKWMISAVAAAFLPHGVSAHGVLVFQGAQYLGKTKWFVNLVPEELGVTATGQLLKPDDKDSVTRVVSNWLVELGELDSTFKKSDIAQLKAFITQKTDVIRRPFDRRESNYARRTVFFGSVNPDEFLADPTGNRRYWTIACDEINYDHGLDMQQIWAEVYETMFKAGESWFLDAEQMDSLNSSNKRFEVVDPIEERISEFFDWRADTSKWRQATVSEALKETGIDRPTQHELNRASIAIKRLNGGMPASRTTKGRFLWIPPSKYEKPNDFPLGSNWGR